MPAPDVRRDHHVGATPTHSVIPVSALTCVADAERLERRLRSTHGVLDAIVNPVTERAYVTFDERCLTEQELRAAIQRFGFG